LLLLSSLLLLLLLLLFHFGRLLWLLHRRIGGVDS
jgi:hypothetical protein